MQVPLDATILLTLILLTPLAAALIVLLWAVQKAGKKWGHIPPDLKLWVEKRWAIRSAAGYLAIYALCLAYGILIEAHWVGVTQTEILVERPILGQERFRIVHLSDLHLEAIGRRERRLVELVREANPHLILLTGDYMNVREGGGPLVQVLSALHAPHGIYGVPGNWDSKFLTRELFQEGRANYLEDETRLIEHEGQQLRLVGQAVHPGTPLREILRGLGDDVFTIYMHHKPDAVDQLIAREPGQRVDLFLCGHTHGGQVRIPFWGAVVTLSKYHKRFEHGLYNFEGVPMYVSRGVGVEGGAVPRVRFLARPEVAVIDLVSR